MVFHPIPAYCVVLIMIFMLFTAFYSSIGWLFFSFKNVIENMLMRKFDADLYGGFKLDFPLKFSKISLIYINELNMSTPLLVKCSLFYMLLRTPSYENSSHSLLANVF